jgi:hypothetical protein
MENIHELGYLDGTPTDVPFYFIFFENLETSVTLGIFFSSSQNYFLLKFLGRVGGTGKK